MTETLIEQLDQALAGLQADPTAHSRVAEELEPLLEVALDLRHLPRDEFKLKLRADLMRRVSMTSTSAEPAKTASYIREGFHTITPYLAVREVQEVIEFVKQTFGAEGQIYGTGSEGGLHGEYRIGDSMLMIGGGSTLR